MDRIWLAHYPPGVPAEIDAGAIPSLAALFDDSFGRFRDRTACIFMGVQFSFGDIEDASRALGAYLQSMGFARGSRVALMMPNTPQYVVALCAVLRAGFVVVNVNPLYTPRELEQQLSDSGAEAIIVLENFAHVLELALPKTAVKHVIVAALGDMLGFVKGGITNIVVRRIKKMVKPYSLPKAVRFNTARATGQTMRLNDPNLGPDDIAFLQYTGGTTGIAKGATLLHRNLIANVMQIEAWQKPMLDRPPYVEALTIATALPLYHVFALTACFLWGMRLGAALLLIPNPRDLPALIAELKRHKVNAFPAVNTLYAALLHHKDFPKIDWSMLKCAIGGGMAVQRSVAEAWVKATGQPIIEGYGLSETSPVLTCNRGDITAWTGTIGFPLSSTEISIRDDAGNEVPLGERGEICARGPQVMAGYWRRPDETAAAMTADGFFRTGDIGVMDDQGRVTIVDRKKDMISVSGFKVYPNEVEDVAMGHGGLLECAAVGMPDEHSGETVALYVVKKKPDVDEEELRGYLRERLTSYKVPRHIEFRSELPKTNVGKILRRALRDEAAKQPPAAKS
jgi:long-chain acyl-CoA synthetase